MTSWLQNEGNSIIEDLIRTSDNKNNDNSFSEDGETDDHISEHIPM